MTAQQTDVSLLGNGLAEPSTLPFGLPPFADVETDHFAPAFDKGMAQHLAEVDAIAANPEPATFENTFVALEAAGALLSRTSYLFFNLASSLATPEIRAVETEFAPRLAAHNDQIRLDTRLFARIDAVHSRAGRPRTLRRAGRSGPALPPGFRVGRRPTRRGRPAETARAEPATLQALHQVSAEPAGVDRGLGAGSHRPRRAGRAERGGNRSCRRRSHRARTRRQLSDPLDPAQQPAADVDVAQSRGAPAAVRGVGQPGVGWRARQRTAGDRDRAGAGASVHGCSASRPTRTRWWPTRPRAAARPWTRCSAG